MRTDERMKKRLALSGQAYTRENYIRANWGRDVPWEEWTGEHEQELPEDLQDWSLFTAPAAPSQEDDNPPTGA